MENANNGYHYIVMLKQETPMWHFQSEQPGCCLRASEVKPKLDRFLNAKNPEKYILPLKYKIYFEVEEGARVTIDEKNNFGKGNFPIYFGNMNEANKHLVFYTKPIQMHLFSFDNQLLNEIEAVLSKFFACHSFGMRQDKGFGCFYPKDKDFDNSEASYSFNTTLSQDTSLTGEFQQLFKFIEMFHKMIRSGVNIPNHRSPEKKKYCKSFMFHYVQNRLNEIWDKPVIRHHFCLTHPTYLQKCGKKENKFVRDEMKRLYPILEEARQKQYDGKRNLFRDALGLSGIQEWKAYDDTLTIEGKGQYGGYPVSIKRFKSPIFYRPVQKKGVNYKGEVSYYYTVYIYLAPIPAAYREAEFTLADKSSKEGIDSKTLLTGMKIYPEFSLENYLDYVIEYCLEKDLEMIGYDKYINQLFMRKKNEKTGKYRLNFRKLTPKK